jgi:hypothetical protein
MYLALKYSNICYLVRSVHAKTVRLTQINNFCAVLIVNNKLVCASGMFYGWCWVHEKLWRCADVYNGVGEGGRICASSRAPRNGIALAFF